MDFSYHGYSINKLQLFSYSVAVMTRAFPVYSVEQRELILLQDAASYLLLACGAVYVVSVSLVNNTSFPNLILELGRKGLHVSSSAHVYFF